MSNEELVAEIQTGATERMGELWDQVVGLVKWKAIRTMRGLEERSGSYGVDFDDLVQSGYPALVKAVETYTPGIGAFFTWFMFYLRNAFRRATGYRTQRERNEPLNTALSLDTPLSDDADSGSFLDVIADPTGQRWRESLEETVWRKQLQEAVETVMEKIPEGCREVLRLRYWEGLTLEEVGNLRGVTKERARQMENKAIRQLRQPRNACHLRPFYDFDFYCHTSLNAFNQSGMSIQERYLIIDEERREREAQERKRRDEEWDRRLKESQKEMADLRARQKVPQRDPFIDEIMQALPPEGREKLQRILAERGRT